MINRVLIRIKVVQLLYSHLLNRSDFKIEPATADTSRDSRFAHAQYIDLLTLMLQLSGYDVRPGNVGGGGGVEGLTPNPLLRGNKLVRSLAENDQMRMAVGRRDAEADRRYRRILPALLDKVENSEIFRAYARRKKRDLRSDAELWKVLIETTLRNDPALLEAARADNPDFTIAGYDRAFEMAAASVSEFASTSSELSDSRNALNHSFVKAYELYNNLLMMMVDLTDMEERRLDNARHKYIPTSDDLNPNMRMVDNRLVSRIRENESLKEYFESNPRSFGIDDEVMLRRLLDAILASDIYKEYMSKAENTYADDCEFWRKIYKNIILPSDELAEALESKSVYWNDDLDIMGEFVIKTIKRLAGVALPENDGDDAGARDFKVFPMFKDDEDERFGPELFADAVNNYDNYRELVQRYVSKSWEMERMAFMDVVILTVAIAELLNFPNIPLAVTVNEYVEIANSYSTAKSGTFVNGMLSAIIQHLRQEGKLLK